MRVLAGDLGGTKTLFCIAECKGADTRIVLQQRFECADFQSFSDMLRAFLDAGAAHVDGIASACFGIAGPVRDNALGQRVKVTNLPWEIDSATLVREFG